MQKNLTLTLPTNAEFKFDKKYNLISKKIETVEIPLTLDVAIKFIQMIGWDIKNNQPITWN